MLNLLWQNSLHAIRSRLLLIVIIFSLALHYLSLKIVNGVKFINQGSVAVLGVKEALFGAIYIHLFVGIFVAAIYGIWMVPYLHSGRRGLLTCTLPVSKWMYPISYTLLLTGLIVIETAVLFLTFGSSFGFAEFSSSTFPWSSILITLGLEWLAFVSIMMGLAFCSLAFGPLVSFFVGIFYFFISQTSGVVTRVASFNGADLDDNPWFKVMSKLPPTGELVFQIKQTFRQGEYDLWHYSLWAIWWLVFTILFTLLLRYPQRPNRTET